jgi:hypothetical protein
MFVVNALCRADIAATLVEVIDANDINREVTKHKPTHCILEALWVTPTKLAELQRLHPRVHFVVRLHSKVPFLAMEGIALQWLREYNTTVATNSLATAMELRPFLNCTPAVLQNIYQPACEPTQKPLSRGKNLWVGCLGAIRPLKNQLMQAVAAIHYAEATGRNLVFHMNARVEQGGEPVQKNIRALFANSRHRLVEHTWLPNHADVLHVVKSFDISLQVSFTETFNIVSADAVWMGVPIVVSDEVSWAPQQTYGKPTDLHTITAAMRRVERAGLDGTQRNRRYLLAHNERALKGWKNFLQPLRRGQ